MNTRWLVAALIVLSLALAVSARASLVGPSISPPKFSQVASGIARVHVRSCASRRILGSGTGFLIGNRVLMTARHVLAGYRSCVYVQIVLAGRNYGAERIYFWRTGAGSRDEARVDVATLRLTRRAPGHVFSFARRTPPRKTTIAMIGFPLGRPISLSQGPLRGTISVKGVPMLIVGIHTAQGSSGSPLLEPDGDVIGILQRGFSTESAGEVTGINLVRWWGRGIVDDLCEAYPSGGIPECTSIEPTPPPPPRPPPPPPPPPAVDVVAGSYKGQTQTGNFVFFNVLTDRTITGWRVNDIRRTCDGPLFIYGSVDLGSNVLAIDRDGRFSREWHYDTTLINDKGEATPADAYLKITGYIHGASASGTVLSQFEFDLEGRHFRCSNGDETWTANLVTPTPTPSPSESVPVQRAFMSSTQNCNDNVEAYPLSVARAYLCIEVGSFSQNHAARVDWVSPSGAVYPVSLTVTPGYRFWYFWFEFGASRQSGLWAARLYFDDRLYGEVSFRLG